MSLLIKNATLNGSKTDLYIQDNRIDQISSAINCKADNVIDAQGKILLPGLMNGHTHAAMTLLRGFGDDMSLFDWLNDKIWPIEAKMTEEDVYWGTKLACLEMIKCGTTFFNDMYWFWPGSVKAVNEMGLRASLSGVLIDLFDKEKSAQQKRVIEEEFRLSKSFPERISYCIGPHAIYTVSADSLSWAQGFAKSNKLNLHLHLSETEKEVHDCIDQHGVRPVEYLEKIGVLADNVSIAHAIWLDDRELELLNQYNVGILTNPCANMKLSAGVFPFTRIQEAGILIGIGTDGVASNNNFDLFEEMKFTALVEKSRTGDPTTAPADCVFDCVTRNTASIFSANCGEIKEGKLADMILIDATVPPMVPGHSRVSDFVYSVNGSVVNTVICDGKILMQDRYISGEETIIAKARETAADLVAR